MGSKFREDYLRVQQIESTKNALIENLLEEYEKLQTEHKASQGQLERANTIADMYYDRCKEFEKQLKLLERTGESNAFISVLIDGDSMNFIDDLIKLGEVGGQQAAQQLRTAVTEHVRSQVGIQHDFDIIVNVYVNLRGLTKTYCDISRILQSREDLERFIRGFNMGHALVNIIDAGNGKECSDAKIKELFRLHMGDAHCKHLIFGGSADNGYARLLGPYSDDANRVRITMLEGPPFAPELSRLAPRFKTASFPNVFRDSKLEARPRSFYAEPMQASTAPVAPMARGTENVKIPSPSTYATQNGNESSHTIGPPPGFGSKIVPRSQTPTFSSVGSNITIPMKRQSTSPPHSSTPSNRPVATPQPGYPEDFMGLNNRGQRVDPPIKASSSIANSLKPRKMCNNYHLRYHCNAGDNCSYEHGNFIEGEQRTALRFLARQVPCNNGLYCEDASCYFGHRCINGTKCKMYGCRFPEYMHGVDEQIVNTAEAY